jgi:hypothetical protein
VTGWERLRDLALNVTAVQIQEMAMVTGPQWTRRTRRIQFEGPGRVGPALFSGAGEDVSWAEVSPDEILTLYPEDLLCWKGSFGDWSARLDAREQTPAYQSLASARLSEPDYLRWALESAAMELALRQIQTSLEEVLQRPAAPLHFCLSMGLGQPPSTNTVRAWREHGDYRFKLDASSAWTKELIAELAGLNCVDVVDLKAYYRDTPVDQEVDPELYARVAQGLPEAVLEDALPNVETKSLLAPHFARLAWDAPIHSVADIAATVPQDWGTPRYLNIKPSRFGTWQGLLEAYAWAEQHQVRCYGGGQFELGIGRAQAQALAALFHPQHANDLAPALFHQATPQAGLPVQQLALDAINETCWLAKNRRPR